ncbi:hypothetical protein [Nocardia jejuensis]|uniref:hypothetical protein n=1 Tax=Nocardia jejuensis TaxID=328049 RepID=UPI0012F75E8C|nr:hypothetical protein [Nocardia jejuensis]
MATPLATPARNITPRRPTGAARRRLDPARRAIRHPVPFGRNRHAPDGPVNSSL